MKRNVAGLPCTTQTMAATAPNESQKPAARTAHGSIRQTSAAASASEVAAPMRELKSHATPTVASMTTVRCAGTPQPASSAYKNAATKPAITAAVCAAAHESSVGERRQIAPMANPTRLAIIVMCNPEMLTRWPMPVRLNNVQSASLMARWSPSTSASSTPPYRLPSSFGANCSRRFERARSIA